MTASQNRALAALLTSKSRTEAAKKAGVTTRTLQNYFSDSDFVAAYRAAFSDLLADATKQGQQSLSPALSTLQDILEDETAPPATRISAARAILEFSIKLTEQYDLVQRINALEGRIEGSALF